MIKNLMNKINNKKNKKGFTLIELIIVIAIIAILAALLLPKLGAVKENSNKTADIATAKTIADAAITLYADDKISGAITPADGVVAKATTDPDVQAIANYLQTDPKMKSKSTGVTQFYVSMGTDGVVEVYGDTTGSVQIYPSASAVFAHK